MKKIIIGFVITAVLAASWFLVWKKITSNIIPSEEPPTPIETSEDIPDVEVILENLTIPWDIAFLPNGEMLVTEREGKLIKFNSDTSEITEIKISNVKHSGEGGLLGIALHPNFEQNRLLYLYFTSTLEGDSTNSVVQFKYENNELSKIKTIVGNIPGELFHNGGRIAFGPNGMLYVATGDARKRESAQNMNSLAGKILRVNDDGSIPLDNPFENEVYSYGHRNPQGLTWDKNKNLWSTEHGRSGVVSGFDELNFIIAGENYGWPDSQGNKVLPGTVSPSLHSGPDITWAPASALYWDGSIFFGGLKGETLYEAVLRNNEVSELKEHYVKDFGRIRTVTLGPDGMFYITTSNRDGRGKIRKGDDKVIRLNPSQFR